MRKLTKTFSKPTIVEQEIKTVVGKEIVTGPMTEALNNLIRERETELLKDWRFYVTSSQNQVFIQLANKKTGVESKFDN